MKFTDGYWNMRPGVTPHYPAHVHEIEIEPDALTLYAPTRRVTHRGDMLNNVLLTVRFSSPLSDVIRVQIQHHKGTRTRKPEFELQAQKASDVLIHDNETAVTMTSGYLTVQVSKTGDWGVDFKSGLRVITRSGQRGMAIIDTDKGRYIHEQLALSVGECVYGLGERFTAFVKNGQSIDIWNQDGGTTSEQAYKNIPFYMTNRGYGVFVNHPERVSFEVASEMVERVQFSVPGEYLEYFLIYGPSPKDVLMRYTALTGRPALPPAWSFGLWLSTSFTTNYDESTVNSLIQDMADHNIPLNVFHFDCFWMKEFHWSNFMWNSRIFPEPEAMLKSLRARGLRICLWINPYIAQQSELFDEGMKHGYLLKRPNGDVWQWDMWQPGMGIVDFTNPNARHWFGDKLSSLVEMGVDCFKTDFGELIPTEVVYYDGSDPVKMHNYYSYLYNQTVFEVLREQRGDSEAVVFARSATAGGQKFPVHWGGDCESTFQSMAGSLRAGLSLTLCGFGFWSHDIGGFLGNPPAYVYKRWIAFGLLSSHSRLHGNQSYRVPWLFDEEAIDVLRHFTQLKCRLMPYLYAQALEARNKGIPIMRAMMLEFPDDPACDYLDRQYMLGESLLVAPVFSYDGVVTYYLPVGCWTNFFTGETAIGPGWMCETHDFMSLPLMVRPNSVIAVGNHQDRSDYDYGNGVILQVYELEDGKHVSMAIVSTIGNVEMTFEVEREGKMVTVERHGVSKPWQLLLVGIKSFASVDGGMAKSSPKGLLVTPLHITNRLKISLDIVK